jgi:hypothetical protein
MKDIVKEYEEIRLTKNAIRALIFAAKRENAGPYDFYKEKLVANPKEAYTAFSTLSKAKFVQTTKSGRKKFVITPLGLSFLEGQFGLRALGIEPEKDKAKEIWTSLAFKR